jgi:undecaprenyl-diphosphatase
MPSSRLSAISFKVILAALLFMGSFGLFSVIAHEVVLEKEDWFDTRVFSFAHAHSSPFVIQCFQVLTFFGSSLFLVPCYLFLIAFLLYRKRKADAINVLILAATSTLLMYVLKISFARHRPELPLFRQLDSYSFPSGHSLSSFVFFSVLVVEIWKSGIARAWKWGWAIFFFLFTLGIGFSRIVLRYHYASDVLAGFCLGLGYVLLFFALQKWVRKKWLV